MHDAHPSVRPSARSSRARRLWPVVLLAACLQAGCSDTPQEMLASARDYLARQDEQAAGIQLRNALQQDGSLAEARFLLGQLYLRQGDLLAARKELERAGELAWPAAQVVPELARALFLSGEFALVLERYAAQQLDEPAAQARLQVVLGDAHLAQAEPAAAAAAYQAALAVQPAMPEARLGMVRVHYHSGQDEAAEAALSALLAERPDDAEALALRARVMMADERLPEAAQAFAAAVRAAPANADYRYELITVLLRLQRLDEARTELAAFRRQAPSSPAAHYLQALLDLRENRLTEARDAVARALAGAPDFVPAHLLAGSVFYRLGEQAQARLSLNKVLERVPDHPVARQMLALSLLAEGEAGRALDTLKPLIDGGAADARSLTVIGQALLANGHFDAAAEYFGRAAGEDPDNAGLRMRLGLARLGRGEAGAAIASLEAAAAMDAQGAVGLQADAAVVLLQLRARNHDAALAAAEQMLQRRPQSAEAHNLMGGVLLARRERGAARAAFGRALELRADLLPAAANLARMAREDGDREAADGHFRRFIAANPGHVEALLALAEQRTSFGAPAAEVRALIDQAVAARPAALRPRLALVRHQLRSGDPQGALASARDIMNTHGKEPAALEALARAQLAAGQATQAVESFGRLGAFSPRAAQPLVEMAGAQLAAGDAAGAEASLRRAVSLQPAHAPAREGLIGLLLQRNRLDDALAEARTLQSVPALAAAGFVAEGDIHGRRAAWPEAVAAYRQALAHTPGGGSRAASAPIQLRLHAALLRSGQQAEAARLAADWLKAQPGDVMMRAYLAEQALTGARHQEAQRLYREVVALSPDNALMLNNLAWVSGRLGDREAVGYAERALALAPDNPAILETLGSLLVEAGRGEEGLVHLRRAVERAPGLAPMRLALVRAYVRLARKAEARQELDALLGQLPGESPLQAEARALRAQL